MAGSALSRRSASGDVRGCTASIIDPLWLLTAASCFAQNGQPASARRPAQPTTATVGHTDLRGTAGQVLPVVDVHPHPQRNLALVRLSAAVTGVSPASLASTAPTAGDTLRAAGFGRTGTEWAPGVLQSAAFGVSGVDATTVVLTGQTQSGAASPCKGDAGGPIVRQDAGGVRIAAVSATSWQTGCLDSAETRDGATGTRVDDLGGWIGQTIDRPYLLHNVATDKCADLAGYGVGAPNQKITQYTCISSQTDNQLWFLDARGRTGDGQVLYSIRNAKDNLCVDVPDYGAMPPGTGIVEYYCAGAEDNQYFRMVPRTGGAWLVNDHSGLCLDVSGAASHANDLPLTYYTCSDHDDHIWVPRL
jgi:Trypsin/Ricin-type beta-trefoil lectin domain